MWCTTWCRRSLDAPPPTEIVRPRSKSRSRRPRPSHRYPWAESMRRVSGLGVLLCMKCRAHRRLIALITQRPVIAAILAHLGLETDPPAIHPARAAAAPTPLPDQRRTNRSAVSATPEGTSCVRSPPPSLETGTQVSCPDPGPSKTRAPGPIRRIASPTPGTLRGFRPNRVLGEAAWSTRSPLVRQRISVDPARKESVRAFRGAGPGARGTRRSLPASARRGAGRSVRNDPRRDRTARPALRAS